MRTSGRALGSVGALRLLEAHHGHIRCAGGLASGSVIVYIGVWSLHLMADLQPWVHFVPCEEVEQLDERVSWVLAHPSEAERISLNAYELFRRVATPEHSLKCVGDALRRLVARPPASPGTLCPSSRLLNAES